MVSTVLAGAAVGSVTAQGLADNLGRRKAFLLDSIPLFVGPLLSAFAGSLAAMLAGRLVAGFGIGLASALVPLYISEARAPAGHVSILAGSVSVQLELARVPGSAQPAKQLIKLTSPHQPTLSDLVLD